MSWLAAHRRYFAPSRRPTLGGDDVSPRFDSTISYNDSVPSPFFHFKPLFKRRNTRQHNNNRNMSIQPGTHAICAVCLCGGWLPFELSLFIIVVARICTSRAICARFCRTHTLSTTAVQVASNRPTASDQSSPF